MGCAQFQGNIANGKIAFESYQDGNYDIYIMNSDGSAQRNLTNSPVRNPNQIFNVHPIPSPDGKTIAFLTNRDGNSEIYVVYTESGAQINLTKSDADEYSPTWSPDGKQIIFVSDRDMSKSAYHSWMNNIYVMDADGSNVQKLTSENEVGYSGLDWSPNGEELVLCLSILDQRGEFSSEGIHIMNLSDTQLTRLTFDKSTIQCNPKWSPDGKRILYSVLGSDVSNIYIMNADGTDNRPLSKDLTTHNRSPSWSPDGNYIVFSSSRDGVSNIYIMETDGTNQTQLTNGSSDKIFPVWLSKP